MSTEQMTEERALAALRSALYLTERPLFDYIASRLRSGAEPVAWMHDGPGRIDVIPDRIKKLLIKSNEAASERHRPTIDKTEHYTIPLYTAPPPRPDPPEVDEALRRDALRYRWLANNRVRELGEDGDFELRHRFGHLFFETLDESIDMEGDNA